VPALATGQLPPSPTPPVCWPRLRSRRGAATGRRDASRDDGGCCWSGSLVVGTDGKPTIFYTSVQLHDLDLGEIRTAHPADDTWDSWRKGPVVAGIAAPADIFTFRDPHVSRPRHGGTHLHISAHDGQLHLQVGTKSWLMTGSAEGSHRRRRADRRTVQRSRRVLSTHPSRQCPKDLDHRQRLHDLRTVTRRIQPSTPHPASTPRT
jgi:Glycosyl hydrolases family 32 N-terminal domain